MTLEDTNPITEQRLLVLSDGRAGHQNQSLGLAAALGFAAPQVQTLRLKYSQMWLRWLPVPWLFEELPNPHDADIILGTGWQISRVLRYLKAQNPSLFTVQCMRPSGKPAHYNAVVMPAHDAGGIWQNAANVVLTLGAPNTLTPEKLKTESDRWAGRLQSCHEPRIAVLVGGASKHGPFGVNEARALMEGVLAAAKTSGGSLLITASRRSGAAVTKFIKHTLENQKTVPYYFWQPDEPNARDNPYFAFLSLAQAVVITHESVAMVSEAATAGKCVYVWGDVGALPKKLQAFYAQLMKQNRVVQWQGRLNMRPPAMGLMDTTMAAGFVRSRWLKKA